MNYQPSTFRGEESWNGQKKDQKVEIFLKLKWFFYLLLTYTSFERASKRVYEKKVHEIFVSLT